MVEVSVDPLVSQTKVILPRAISEKGYLYPFDHKLSFYIVCIVQTIYPIAHSDKINNKIGSFIVSCFVIESEAIMKRLYI